jgi:hypothetical protein
MALSKFSIKVAVISKDLYEIEKYRVFSAQAD